MFFCRSSKRNLFENGLTPIITELTTTMELTTTERSTTPGEFAMKWIFFHAVDDS